MLLADTMWLAFREWFYLPKRLKKLRRPDPQSFPDIHCLWINLFLKGSLLLFFSTMRLLRSFALFERDDHIHEHESHILGNILSSEVWNHFCLSFLEFRGPRNQNLGHLSLIFETSQQSLQGQWGHLIFVEARQLLCGPLCTLGESNLYYKGRKNSQEASARITIRSCLLTYLKLELGPNRKGFL